MTKLRQGNDVTNCTSLLYVEKWNWTVMTYSIDRTVYDEAREDNDVIDRTSVVYSEIETVLSWPIGKDAVYHEK